MELTIFLANSTLKFEQVTEFDVNHEFIEFKYVSASTGKSKSALFFGSKIYGFAIGNVEEK